MLLYLLYRGPREQINRPFLTTVRALFFVCMSSRKSWQRFAIDVIFAATCCILLYPRRPQRIASFGSRFCPVYGLRAVTCWRILALCCRCIDNAKFTYDIILSSNKSVSALCRSSRRRQRLIYKPLTWRECGPCFVQPPQPQQHLTRSPTRFQNIRCSFSFC
jgi:hypothetical protein